MLQHFVTIYPVDWYNLPRIRVNYNSLGTECISNIGILQT